MRRTRRAARNRGELISTHGSFIVPTMGGNSEPLITLEKAEDGGFLATCPSLPGFVARGDTEGAAIRKIRRALSHSFKDQQRDFIRLGEHEGSAESFRWSRYRVPLYFRLPLSRNVKLTLSAFAAGVVVGTAVFAARRARARA